jgi:tight adherence protein B
VKIIFIVVIAGISSLGLFFIMEKVRKEEQNKKNKQLEKVNGLEETKKIELIENNSQESKTEKNMALLDYNVYEMSKKERFFYICIAAGGLFFIAYVFYRSIILSVLVTPLAFYYPKIKTKEIIERRKRELSLQFKEALYALSSSLIAGRSVEAAFKESLKDLSLIYPDPHTDIIQEFEYITRRIEMNETIEDALYDFANRAHLEDIDSFVDVFIISKRTGGNIVDIIKNTSAIIGDKLQIKQEIDTLLSQRKFEQKVLNVMPIAMILLLTWTTGDYMAPVFNTIIGRIAMTVAVFLLGLAYFISKKIISIEV